MPDFDERMARLRDQVQQALDAFIAHHRDDLLGISPELAPALDAVVAMTGSGKRLRAAACYWGHIGAGGTDSAAIITAAASLELLQASALIHDDVMDHSDTRRGQPAVHRRFAALHAEHGWQGTDDDFGAAAAILIGDLALVWADAMLCSAPFDDAALHRAKRVFDRMRTELMGGQFLDVLEQARGGGSVERAARVMRFKTTAYTVERPLHLGAALAGDHPEVEAVYPAFGVPLGEAFQLRDDILGVFGDPERTGKPAGDDLREGKRTLLIALAQERATPAQAAVLEREIGNPELDATGVAAVREVLSASGALDAVERRIAEGREQALAALRPDVIAAEAIEALRALADAATVRTA